MATGMEWAFNALMTYLQIDPEEAKKSLAATTQIIVNADSRLTRLENNQLAIMRHLGISPEVENGPAITNGRANAIASAIRSEQAENGTGKETDATG